MAIKCISGFSLHSIVSTPASSQNVDFKKETYIEKKYEIVRANNSPAHSANCNTKTTFTETYTVSASGTVSAMPFGSGVSATTGTDIQRQISITLGGDSFEYQAFLVYVEETTITGTISKSGGFTNSKIGLFFRLMFSLGDLSVLIPKIEFHPDKEKKDYTQIGFMVCKKECPKKKAKKEVKKD